MNTLTTIICALLLATSAIASETVPLQLSDERPSGTYFIATKPEPTLLGSESAIITVEVPNVSHYEVFDAGPIGGFWFWYIDNDLRITLPNGHSARFDRPAIIGTPRPLIGGHDSVQLGLFDTVFIITKDPALIVQLATTGAIVTVQWQHIVGAGNSSVDTQFWTSDAIVVRVEAASRIIRSALRAG